AVAVDPSQPIAPSEVVDVPEPVAEPTSEVVVPIDVPAIPPAAAPKRVRAPGVHVRVFGGPEYGAVPKTTGAIGGAVGLRGRGWRAEIDGSWAFARTAALSTVPEVTARIGRWSIAGRGCGVPARGRIEVPLCAAIEAGQLVGRGTGETIGKATKER